MAETDTNNQGQDESEGEAEEEDTNQEPPDTPEDAGMKTESGDVDEENFGYSVVGTWDEIVDFAKSITTSFKLGNVESDTIDEWEDWRPRDEEERREAREENMREKTVEKAKVEEGEDVRKMKDDAAENLSKTQKHTTEGKIDKAAESATESAKSAGKAVEGAGRDVMRVIEDWVYDKITKTNPLYFDTDEFNASLEKVSSLPGKLMGNGDDEEQEYKLSIKPQSQEVEDALDDSFGDEETSDKSGDERENESSDGSKKSVED